MKSGHILYVIVLLAAHSVYAGQLRIDCVSSVPITLSPQTKACSIFHPGWEPEEKRNSMFCVVSYKPLFEKYTEYSFTFTPNADGTITLKLLGEYDRPKDKKQFNRHYQIIDAMSATGAVIKNGSFEEPSPDNPNLPKFWNYVGSDPKFEAELLQNGDAVDGTKSVKTMYLSGFSQTITVKKGVPVTIKLMAKDGGFVAAEE